MNNMLDRLLTLNFFHKFILWALLLTIIFMVGSTAEKKILSWPTSPINISNNDTDSWIRLAKISHWLQSPDFYDDGIHNTNAPHGDANTQWTKPTDLVIAPFFFATSDDHSIQKRLMLSTTWSPLFLGAFLILILSKAANISYKSNYKLGIIISGFIFFAFSQYHFYPGNADHHNLQSVLWGTILLLLLSPPTKICSICLGIIMGIWLWVGIEAFIILIPLFLYWTYQSVTRPDTTHYNWTSCLSASVTLLAALAIENNPSQAFQTIQYDTLSIPHAVLMSVSAVYFSLLGTKIFKTKPLLHRYIIGLSIGAIFAISFHFAFPQFIEGPFAGLDKKYIATEFLSKISEAKPIYEQPMQWICSILFLPICALLLSCLFLKQNKWMTILLLACMAMTCWQMRWFYYLEPIAILILAIRIPTFLRYISMKTKSKNKFLYHPYLALCCLIALHVTLQHLTAIKSEPTPKIVDIMACSDDILHNIQSGSLQKTIGNHPVTIETTNNKAAGALLFFTPYKIITTQLHREISGVKSYRDIIFAKTPDDALPIIKARKLDYLVICPQSKDSWLNAFFTSQNNDISWARKIVTLESLSPTDHHKPILLELTVTD